MERAPLTDDQILGLLLDDALDAFIVLDDQNRVVMWSPYAESLFGWSSSEAMGACLNDLIIPPRHHDAHMRGIQQYLQSGQQINLSRRVEVTALRKDRSTVDIELTVMPRNIDGRIYFAASIRDNSERKREREKLQEQAALLDLTRDAIIVLSAKETILWWNRGAEIMFGFSPEEAVGKIHYRLLKTIFPDAPQLIRKALSQAGYWEGELQHFRADGASITTFCRCVVVREEEGRPEHILVSATDISLLKQNRLQRTLLQIFKQRFDALFDKHPDGVFAFNPQSRLISANPALAALSGYSIQELITSPRARIIAPEHLQNMSDHLARALAGKPQHFEAVLVHKNGGRTEVDVALTPILVDSEVHGVHGVLKDISSQKEFDRIIYYRANHDQLTGLPNRAMLEDRFQHAMEQARRLRSQVGVLFLDLNRFKFVNDTLGHEIGDKLLCAVAERLKNTVREIDTVSRLGGDEFVVLIENMHHKASDLHIVTNNILHAISQPFFMDGHELNISTSVGASIYPVHGTDMDTLLKAADLAMYQAKSDGPGNFQLYSEQSAPHSKQENTFAEQFQRALQNNELVLHYLPKIKISTGEITGLEALVRWNHPQKGLLPAANFIADVEAAGLLCLLDEWVVDAACRQHQALQGEGWPSLRVSVNLAIGQHCLADIVDKVLQRTGFNACLLEIDLRESQVAKDPLELAESLNRLQGLGVALSLDDYGTGKCSITDLKHLAFSSLKIHESLVKGVSSHADKADIVNAMIAMAHSLRMRVIAEGVSLLEEMQTLMSYGCDEVQGYLICAPLAVPDAKKYLQERFRNGTLIESRFS